MASERVDGRVAEELRTVNITPKYLQTAPGSVLIEVGQTRVICTVSVEDRVPPFLVGKGVGWLTAEYGMLPGSSERRIARESSTGKVNGRTREIQRLIGRSLRSIIDLDNLAERTLHIDCDVIQADGGTRTASITGAYVALVEAIKKLIAEGVLEGNPLIDAVAAISVGVVGDRVLLDLCYEEDVQAQTDMNLVMTGSGGIVEVQATAEGRPFTRGEAEQMLDIGSKGIRDLLALQEAVLKDC